MMTYALGRGVEYFDMPVVRSIVRDAESDEYRFEECKVHAEGAGEVVALHCAEDEVKYTFIDAMNRGVEGCDKRLSYVWHNGRWVANVSGQ